MVHRRSEDDAVNLIAGGDGVRQRLEHDCADAFPGDKPAGVESERPRHAVSGHHAQATELRERRRVRIGVHAADDGDGAIAGVEVEARFVERRERRGAGGVDRHLGPVKLNR